MSRYVFLETYLRIVMGTNGGPFISVNKVSLVKVPQFLKTVKTFFKIRSSEKRPSSTAKFTRFVLSTPVKCRENIRENESSQFPDKRRYIYRKVIIHHTTFRPHKIDG